MPPPGKVGLRVSMFLSLVPGYPGFLVTLQGNADKTRLNRSRLRRTEGKLFKSQADIRARFYSAIYSNSNLLRNIPFLLLHRHSVNIFTMYTL